jgi:hypothetical protein
VVQAVVQTLFQHFLVVDLSSIDARGAFAWCSIEQRCFVCVCAVPLECFQSCFSSTHSLAGDHMCDWSGL